VPLRSSLDQKTPTEHMTADVDGRVAYRESPAGGHCRAHQPVSLVIARSCRG
jgi:hypothetical protein